MTFVTILFESLTAGQLSIFVFSHLLLAGLGVSTGFIWGSKGLRRWREDEVMLVAIERDPARPDKGTYIELGTGFPFTESGTMYITPTSLITTRHRAEHQGAKPRSPLFVDSS